MARHKRSPAPAGRPGTGRIEIELGGFPLSPIYSSNPTTGEALAVAWLARRGVRPALVGAVAELASIGGAA